MPLYEYVCREHGSQVVEQEMTDIHKAICLRCNKPMQRVYCAPSIKIGNQKPKLGKTRGELYKNLEAEGIASKDFAYHDKETYFDNQRMDL